MTLFGFGVLFYKIEQLEKAIVIGEEPKTLNISPGSNFYQLVRELELNIPHSETSIKIWSKLNKEKTKVKAGYYEFDANATFMQVITKVNNGKVKQFSTTLVEGQTIKQWFEQLKNEPNLSNRISIEQIYDSLVEIDPFCVNPYENIEGCLLPDTYFFSYQDSVLSILVRAYRAMKDNLEQQWSERYGDIPLNSPYEALILASIIEKETALDDERGQIAGVFVNRLNKGMRLQTDPTVIYGVGDAFDGDITRVHLNTHTPYNTYKIDGLPITPIAMPSLASLKATVRPELTSAYYFVASGRGGHVFSETLDEHNKAVQQYLATLRKKR